MMRYLPRPSVREQWRRLAPEYGAAVGRGEKGDFLRFRLLTPRLLRILGPLEGRRVLDVGCGDGYLARRMAAQGARVWAFDWLEVLIARAGAQERKKPLGIVYAVADATRRFPFAPGFDLLVANMVLKDMPRLDATLLEACRVLRKGGRVVVSVLHPCFSMNRSQWRARKALGGKNRKLGFELDAPYTRPGCFVKTVSGSKAEITHFHRPISWYVDRLARSGFRLEGLWEPVLRPGKSVPERYAYATLLPPFLILSGVKS